MGKIVDINTLKEVPDGETGEVWLCSGSKCEGYFKKEELTKEVFHAKLTLRNGELDREHEYLRTGDLAFFQNDLLFICGRLKDVIIHQGVNYYPQDIEGVTQASTEAIRQGCTCAFSSEDGSDVEVVFEIREQ